MPKGYWIARMGVADPEQYQAYVNCYHSAAYQATPFAFGPSHHRSRPMRAHLAFVACVAVAVAVSACNNADRGPDRELLAVIDTIGAIDSHAHPMAVVAAGAPADSEYDALPLDALPSFDVPLALRPGNPTLGDAQKALYGTVGGDSGSSQAKAFDQAHADVMKQQGAHFPTWVLDQLHVSTMLANRVAMGAGHVPPRFRWVTFADPLMLPLDLTVEAARTPDTKVLYPLEAKLRQRYLHDLGIASLPPTLAQYEHDVVTATLEKQHAAGAVAVKFEAAYLRSLDFGQPDAAAATATYARYARGGAPTHAEYTRLEDHLVRVIAREAGRIGLAVQFHSADGFGAYYSPANAAPHNLESLLIDPSLAKTRFIIVHGGWPLVNETMSLMGKHGVYADLSLMDQVAEPGALARTLRLWLGAWPDKVLFGTDAFEAGPQSGWELSAWVASHNARVALAEALSGMVRDGEIDMARARQLAKMVLHDNAVAAYALGKP